MALLHQSLHMNKLETNALYIDPEYKTNAYVFRFLEYDSSNKDCVILFPVYHKNASEELMNQSYRFATAATPRFIKVNENYIKLLELC